MWWIPLSIVLAILWFAIILIGHRSN